MTQQPTAAALRAAQAIHSSFIKSGFDPGEPTTFAHVIDLTTHLPELIAFVKEWREVIKPLAPVNAWAAQFIHEADQLLKQVEG